LPIGDTRFYLGGGKVMRIRRNTPVDTALNDEEFLAVAKISDALAHPVRIRLLRYILTENLARRTVTNKDLVGAFSYAQATISQHVSKLIIGGLLEAQSKGTSSCYFARVGKLLAYTETIKKIDTRAAESEMPEFLRTQFFEPEDTSDGLSELDALGELDDLGEEPRFDVLEGQIEFSPEETHYL